MNLEKIKDSARKFEAAQDWRRAIEVYQKAIQEFESGADPSPDVGVYNKVGDLHIKANEPAAATSVSCQSGRSVTVRRAPACV